MLTLEEFLCYADESTGLMETYDSRVFAKNASCGDSVTIDIKITPSGKVLANHFSVGCYLCKASAGYLCETASGLLTVDEAKKLELPKFPVAPLRLKCMHLALNTFREALNGTG